MSGQASTSSATPKQPKVKASYKSAKQPNLKKQTRPAHIARMTAKTPRPRHPLDKRFPWPDQGNDDDDGWEDTGSDGDTPPPPIRYPPPPVDLEEVPNSLSSDTELLENPGPTDSDLVFLSRTSLLPCPPRQASEDIYAPKTEFQALLSDPGRIPLVVPPAVQSPEDPDGLWHRYFLRKIHTGFSAWVSHREQKMENCKSCWFDRENKVMLCFGEYNEVPGVVDSSIFGAPVPQFMFLRAVGRSFNPKKASLWMYPEKVPQIRDVGRKLDQHSALARLPINIEPAAEAQAAALRSPSDPTDDVEDLREPRPHEIPSSVVIVRGSKGHVTSRNMAQAIKNHLVDAHRPVGVVLLRGIYYLSFSSTTDGRLAFAALSGPGVDFQLGFATYHEFELAHLHSQCKWSWDADDGDVFTDFPNEEESEALDVDLSKLSAEYLPPTPFPSASLPIPSASAVSVGGQHELQDVVTPVAPEESAEGVAASAQFDEAPAEANNMLVDEQPQSLPIVPPTSEAAFQVELLEGQMRELQDVEMQVVPPTSQAPMRVEAVEVPRDEMRDVETQALPSTSEATIQATYEMRNVETQVLPSTSEAAIQATREMRDIEMQAVPSTSEAAILATREMRDVEIQAAPMSEEVFDRSLVVAAQPVLNAPPVQTAVSAALQEFVQTPGFIALQEFVQTAALQLGQIHQLPFEEVRDLLLAAPTVPTPAPPTPMLPIPTPTLTPPTPAIAPSISVSAPKLTPATGAIPPAMPGTVALQASMANASSATVPSPTQHPANYHTPPPPEMSPVMPRNFTNTRSEVVRGIQWGLVHATGNVHASMQYTNYEHAVVARYGWRFVGWPPNLPMQPLSQGGSGGSAHIKNLWEGLKHGQCYWARVPASELQALECSAKAASKKRKLVDGGAEESQAKKRRS